MIYSMTGFGKAEQTKDGFTCRVEIKSLNSRSADIKAKLPNNFREKDVAIKNLVATKLHRGKIDVLVTSKSAEEAPEAEVNKGRFLSYFNQLSQLAKETRSSTDEVFSLALNMPEVVESSDKLLDEKEWKLAQSTLDEAMDQLMAFRKAEGGQLYNDLEARKSTILETLEKIEKLAPERTEQVRERLRQKVDELNALQDEDRSRLEQEIVFYLEKYDINEEIVRLKSHCRYFTEVLENEEVQGKKLGFIGQEMGREINTIGSKANHSEIQKLVVGMKDELEKIKEQLLNIL